MITRILHIVPTLDYGGASLQAASLCEGLPPAELACEVVALGGGQNPLAARLRHGGTEVFEFGARWNWDPIVLGRLRGHIANRPPAIVHLWDMQSLPVLAVVPASVPVLVSLHGLRPPGELQHSLLRWLARRAQAIVVNSRAAGGTLAECGWPRDRLRQIECGVPLPAPGFAMRGQFLAELGLPAGARLIALVGGLEWNRRVKDAIWAADLLKVVRRDAHLLIIGSGPHEARLRRYRSLVRIEDRVHFLGARADAARLVALCDVAWSMSAVRGRSLAMLEAMAAGAPVVVADVPAHREVIDDGRNGFLAPLGDRATFASRTHRLFEEREVAAAVGEAGRQTILERHALDAYLAAYAGLYRALRTTG